MLYLLEKKILKKLHLNLNCKNGQHVLLLLWIAVFVLSVFSYYSKEKQIVFFKLCFYQPWLFTNYEYFWWIHAHLFARVQLERFLIGLCRHAWATCEQNNCPRMVDIMWQWLKEFYLRSVACSKYAAYCGGAPVILVRINNGNSLKYWRKKCVSY